MAGALTFSKDSLYLVADGNKPVCNNLKDRPYSDEERWAIYQEWREGEKNFLSNRKVAAILFDVALGSFEWETPF